MRPHRLGQLQLKQAQGAGYLAPCSLLLLLLLLLLLVVVVVVACLLLPGRSAATRLRLRLCWHRLWGLCRTASDLQYEVHEERDAEHEQPVTLRVKHVSSNMEVTVECHDAAVLQPLYVIVEGKRRRAHAHGVDVKEQI
jgi:hypothetical protein